jgi:hypothetical protein
MSKTLGSTAGQQHRLGGGASAQSASRTTAAVVFRHGLAAPITGVGDDNGRRATAAVMRYGCRRVECFEGYEPRLRGTAHARERTGARPSGHEAGAEQAVSRNAANPVRTGLQHVRNPRAEQTVEVVRIHEDGTRCAAGGAGTPKEGGNTDREWTHRGAYGGRGNAGQAQERRIKRLIRGESWRAEGGAKPMEDALGVHCAHHERVRRRKTSGTERKRERSKREQ